MTGVSKRVVPSLCAVLTAFVLLQAAPALAAHDPMFVRAFGAVGTPTCTNSCTAGSEGPDAGQFHNPNGMAVSGSGDVYVADTGNNRVSEFSPAGAFVRAFGKDVGGSGVDVCTSSCQAGSAGGAAGQLDGPVGVAVSGSGDVYVADTGNNRVDEFTQAGAFVRAFGKDVGGSGVDGCTSPCVAGSAGGAAGQLDGPVGVAVSGSGDVYVGDTNNERVDEFTQVGVFVQAFGKDVKQGGGDVCEAVESCQAGTAGGGAAQLSNPEGVAVTGSGDVYVADEFNHRVAEFSQAGVFVRAFGKDVGGSSVRVCTSVCHAGGAGGGPGQLDFPQGVAVSGSGDVYVADTFNQRVDEFSQAGVFVRAFGKGVGGGVDVCTSLCQAGSVGGGAGQLKFPVGVAVSGSGDVYVGDTQNDRVSEFSQSGVFVRAFGAGVGAAPFNCTTASGCQAGRAGGASSQLDFPVGLAVSGSGDVYVADTDNNRVDEFSQSGVFVRAFAKDVGGTGVDVCTSSCVAGSGGDGSGQLDRPEGVAVSGSGDVYVGDMDNDRVDEFSQSGVFVRAFGKDVGGSGVDVCTSSCVAGSAGGGAGQLDSPRGVAVSGSGDVYVADTNNNRVSEFSQAGVFVRTFGSPGGGAGQLNFPTGVGVSGSGDVYVTERGNNRVSEFSQAGVFERAFGKDVGGGGVDVCTGSCVAGSAGAGAGQLDGPRGVAVSGSGDVYVGDANNNRVSEFSQAGLFLRTFGSLGGGAGQLDFPNGVGVSGSGDIYIADESNQRIAEFTPTNAAPVAVADAYSTNEDSALTVNTASGVLGNDTDADGDPLTAVAYTDPQHGTLSHNADGSFTYTPASNFNGQDSFTYRANDGQSDSAPATVTITVNPVDDAPVAVGDVARVRANSGATTIAVLANDTDIDGGPKAVAALTQPAHGTAAITGGGAGVTYKPRRGYCNTSKGGHPDTFSYTLNGGSQATVAVTVTCPPQVTIGHRAAHTTRTATSIRLTCKVTRCKGTLSLQATSLGTRLRNAKAIRPAHFNLRAGATKLIRVQIPAASRKQLATKHHAVARAVAHVTGGATVKRLLSLASR